MHPPVSFLSILKHRRAFIIITGIILLLILTLQIVNKRFWMHDFEVYYLAARAYLNGQPVYGQTFIFDTAFYKYSPFSLYLFVPFGLLPFGVAKVLFFLLISAASISSLILAAHILHDSLQGQSISNGRLFIVLGIVSSQVFRELHLGNVNMILLLLTLIMLWTLLKGHQVQAGILFALVLIFKPHFVILAPLFLFRKKFITLVITLSVIVTSIFLTALFKGISETQLLYSEWLQTMQKHNASFLQAYDTIYSLFLQKLQSLHLYQGNNTESAVVITLLAFVALAFGWFVLTNIRRDRILQPQQRTRSFVIEFLILVALIPNLVITDSEHFLLSTPLILLLLTMLQYTKAVWFNIASITAIILYAMNIHDLVGAEMSLWLTQHGILGFANLILIGLTIYGYLNFEQEGKMFSPRAEAQS